MDRGDERLKKRISTDAICLIALIGLIVSLVALTVVIYNMTKEHIVIWVGLGLLVVTICWIVILILLLRKKMLNFTSELCNTLDSMMNFDESISKIPSDETLFSRFQNRLSRLYEIMKESRNRIDEDHRELQGLVSDISHQIKTPVSNLKMLTETMLTKKLSDGQKVEFLQDIATQAEKLDFLFDFMVKSSRLESGIIKLESKNKRIYDTVAQALSGIACSAERKSISVEISCPENLRVYHDSKWTCEAIFNILDNAVKYTEYGGTIKIEVFEWEMYVNISIYDSGKGIPEELHGAVFRRFFREEGVHDVPGVGIGLYLAREIVTRQGGYIKLSSGVGLGSTFSIFLPKN